MPLYSRSNSKSKTVCPSNNKRHELSLRALFALPVLDKLPHGVAHVWLAEFREGVWAVEDQHCAGGLHCCSRCPGDENADVYTIVRVLRVLSAPTMLFSNSDVFRRGAKCNHADVSFSPRLVPSSECARASRRLGWGGRNLTFSRRRSTKRSIAKRTIVRRVQKGGVA